MSCRFGLASLRANAQLQEEKRKKGEEIQRENMKHMREALPVFQKSLEEFAKKHKKEIKEDPEFRMVCCISVSRFFFTYVAAAIQ